LLSTASLAGPRARSFDAFVHDFCRHPVLLPDGAPPVPVV
jgi:hypothetical protein